jgi:hypothetical protein
MAEQPLRASQAARRLRIPTRDLLVLVRERKIGYVMQDGIVHIPIAAVTEYRSTIPEQAVRGHASPS